MAQLGTTTPVVEPVATSTAVVVKAEAAEAKVIRDQAAALGLAPELAVSIARCESTLRQFNPDGTLLRGMVTPSDVGIFQINEQYHLERSRELGYDIYTLDGNVGYALWLMKREGTKHWNWSRDCWSPQT
jgi:hypothetical protein